MNQRGEVSPTLHCAVLPCGGDGMALLALATAEELVPASVLVTNAGASVCAACLLYSVSGRTVVRFNIVDSDIYSCNICSDKIRHDTCCLFSRKRGEGGGRRGHVRYEPASRLSSARRAATAETRTYTYISYNFLRRAQRGDIYKYI